MRATEITEEQGYTATQILAGIHERQGYIIGNSLTESYIGEITDQAENDVYIGVKLRTIGMASKDDFVDQLRAIGLAELISEIWDGSYFHKVQVLD